MSEPPLQSKPSVPNKSMDIPAPTIIDSKKKSFKKRQVDQRPSDSVVHITITAAGTVVYTHTATSYSFVPSYSAIAGNNNTSSNNNGNNGNNNNSGNSNDTANKGAIIGGVVGGVAVIALIAIGFFCLRRSKKQKRVLGQNEGGYIEDNGSYFGGATGARASSAGMTGGNMGMTSSVPAARHLVAPFAGLGTEREGDGLESKHYLHDGGYYDDVIPPNNTHMYPQNTFYSTTDSVTSGSLPSTAVDNSYSSQNFAPNGRYRNIPNEVDDSPPTAANPTLPIIPRMTTEERHVPHLKDTDEPPHAKE